MSFSPTGLWFCSLPFKLSLIWNPPTFPTLFSRACLHACRVLCIWHPLPYFDAFTQNEMFFSQHHMSESWIPTRSPWNVAWRLSLIPQCGGNHILSEILRYVAYTLHSYVSLALSFLIAQGLANRPHFTSETTQMLWASRQSNVK